VFKDSRYGTDVPFTGFSLGKIRAKEERKKNTILNERRVLGWRACR